MHTIDRHGGGMCYSSAHGAGATSSRSQLRNGQWLLRRLVGRRAALDAAGRRRRRRAALEVEEHGGDDDEDGEGAEDGGDDRALGDVITLGLQRSEARGRRRDGGQGSGGKRRRQHDACARRCGEGGTTTCFCSIDAQSRDASDSSVAAYETSDDSPQPADEPACTLTSVVVPAGSSSMVHDIALPPHDDGPATHVAPPSVEYET